MDLKVVATAVMVVAVALAEVSALEEQSACLAVTADSAEGWVREATL